MQRLDPLQLGPEVIGQLLQQRRPLLMIDGTEGFAWRDDHPALKTYKNVSANEPIFDGHFPDLMLWPGIYTLEGVGQTCHLLGALCGYILKAKEKGVSQEDALACLAGLHRMKRFEPVTRVPEAEALLRSMAEQHDTTPGVTAAVDMKFLAPVFAGDRIDFTVELVKKFDAMLRFDVKAEVRGRMVLKGTHTGSMGLVLTGREVTP